MPRARRRSARSPHAFLAVRGERMRERRAMPLRITSTSSSANGAGDSFTKGFAERRQMALTRLAPLHARTENPSATTTTKPRGRPTITSSTAPPYQRDRVVCVRAASRHHGGVRNPSRLALSALFGLVVCTIMCGLRESTHVGVLLAAGVSWTAIPGPGEAALIAAGISAAHGRLDLSAVVAVAFAGATVGGSAGWPSAGRAVVGCDGTGTAAPPAPLLADRQRGSLL